MAPGFAVVKGVRQPTVIHRPTLTIEDDEFVAGFDEGHEVGLLLRRQAATVARHGSAGHIQHCLFIGSPGSGADVSGKHRRESEVVKLPRKARDGQTSTTGGTHVVCGVIVRSTRIGQRRPADEHDIARLADMRIGRCQPADQ